MIQSAESFGEVAKVCEDPSFHSIVNDSQVYATLIYNSSHVFAFDDEAAFKEKLCRLKAGSLVAILRHRRVRLGIRRLLERM
ncbi:hypothetical protein MTO96_017600 [Rhipicephalus appendiculatus]